MCKIQSGDESNDRTNNKNDKAECLFLLTYTKIDPPQNQSEQQPANHPCGMAAAVFANGDAQGFAEMGILGLEFAGKDYFHCHSMRDMSRRGGYRYSMYQSDQEGRGWIACRRGDCGMRCWSPCTRQPKHQEDEKRTEEDGIK